MKHWIFVFACAFPVAAQLAPSDLRVEYLRDPLGVDVARPRFSFVPEDSERGAKQSAFQIVVSSGGATVWDSGKQSSDDTAQVEYAGKALESNRSYDWRVRWWDQADHPSPWAQAHFDTGLSASDWKAHWIRGANELRKEFSLDSKPVRARAFVAGIGYYELRINGRKVGDRVLDSPYTVYSKRILYSTYDVTGMLNAGPNAVSVMLGEGWFRSRAAIVQIEVEMAGGGRVTIASDATWKSAAGPILSDSIYNGETYDARKETPGWDRAGFNDAGWEPASLDDAPTGVLSSEMMPPIRVTGSIMPVKITSPKPGMWVFDFGQNFSGWVRLKVRGPAGDRVKLRHAEVLYDDGNLNVENLRGARATDVYILKGSGEELYEPRFTYHGFRYVELSGFPGTPEQDTLLARVVHSDVQPIGGFSASKTILNQIQHNILWGIESNLESIPTDCNQRDERMGWMADAHLYSETAMLNFDMAAFYNNFLRDIRDSQSDDGSVPDTVPRARFARGPADPAWGSAFPLIAWYMYERYGDRRALEENFDGIRRWTDFLTTRAHDGTVDFFKYGDWVPITRTPGPLVSTFYYYVSADITARAAEVLEKKDQAGQYRELAGQIKAAFQARFFDKENGTYGNGSQTSDILALAAGVAPRGSPTLDRLTDNIVYEHDTHLSTGIIGTKYLLPLLTRTGNAELAYELAVETSYPSWGYMVEHGATTLWELWQEKTGDSMNSHNHPMFGSIGAWFYEALAGINFDAKQPGYRRIRIQPQVVGDLKWASGTLETIRGTVSSSWSRSGDALRMEVTIPVASTAEVWIPESRLEGVTVTESGKTVWKNGQPAEGASARERGDWIVVEIGSGSYLFERSGT
ncbi:MAG TPA: family 78 glycoside hydrolase catalytic domain [Bryobacteraceae bacterium]|nr:family 78 glycoside hydrolase catalytic domain [Bryobacteraceae bacterium]